MNVYLPKHKLYPFFLKNRWYLWFSANKQIKTDKKPWLHAPMTLLLFWGVPWSTDTRSCDHNTCDLWWTLGTRAVAHPTNWYALSFFDWMWHHTHNQMFLKFQPARTSDALPISLQSQGGLMCGQDADSKMCKSFLWRDRSSVWSVTWEMGGCLSNCRPAGGPL